MKRKGAKIIPFSRDLRKPRKFDMGLPPKRQGRRTLLDPRIYLKGVMVAGFLGLLVVPVGADTTLALTKTVQMEDRRCRIVRVVDGDTVSLLCGLSLQRARLTGFDTPELFSPRCSAEGFAAWQAKLALRVAFFEASDIKFIGEGQDRYNRLLARVLVDGQPLAGKMVENGYARPYAGGQRTGWCA